MDDTIDTLLDNTCSICLENMDEKDKYLLEQCGHIFHANCIVRNIQTGNISCPCCRKLPNFVTNVDRCYDLREDLIDDYNEKEKKKTFQKSIGLVKKGEASKSLIKLMKRYNKLKDKNKNKKIFNREVLHQEKELGKELDKTYVDEQNEYNAIGKKYALLRKNIRKEKNIPNLKHVDFWGSSNLYNEIVQYLGFTPVGY